MTKTLNVPVVQLETSLTTIKLHKTQRDKTANRIANITVEALALSGNQDQDLARRFFRSNREMFDLIAEPKPPGGFEIALKKLFLESGDGARTAEFGEVECCFAGASKGQVAFLPNTWRVELDKLSDAWPGCEKWWAGYPLIALIDARAHDDGVKGYLKLHFEVGPLADYALRTSIIGTIAELAREIGLQRIHFPPEGLGSRSLYSRFLRWNSSQVSAFSDPDEVEVKLRELMADFSAEAACVASSVSRIQTARRQDSK